jgi:adenylylsulfate kinase
MSKFIIPHDFNINKQLRAERNQHRAFVLWFTGLSGSGKSTIANAVEQVLFSKNLQTYSLDGDALRTGLNADLDFSTTARDENLRRVAEVSKLFTDAGMITLAAFISPLKSQRDTIKQIIGADNFYEIFVDTPVAVCEARDVKGLYAKARAGIIKDFTGVSAPYEAPDSPDLVVKTAELSLEDSVEKVVNFVMQKL